MTRPTARPAPGAVLAIALALAVAAAGCGASTTSTTAAPPTGSVPTPVASSGSDGDIVLTAENIAFAPTELSAPAGTPFTLQFLNKDPGVPHDVEIRDGQGRSVYRSEIVTGPATTAFEVPPLEAGSYTFVCTVHPNMTGTLAVGG